MTRCCLRGHFVQQAYEYNEANVDVSTWLDLLNHCDGAALCLLVSYSIMLGAPVQMSLYPDGNTAVEQGQEQDNPLENKRIVTCVQNVSGNPEQNMEG